ncbi:TetR/AcrR family transcriptional regulator [Streptomyces sp. NPDC002018]|uniref:TetR/AcrR family transcriptional regulator n=1 Tax=Streptomyces sp. NPDC002018 TaxID=3364629 RepID=UPI0036B19509
MARVREFDTEAAVEAAMNAFRVRGFEGTSVQDLIDATGVGRGSLYAAFGSKEGLYLAAVDRYRQNYALPLIDIFRSGAPVRELIRAVLVDLVDDIVNDGDRLACLIVSAATERVPHDRVVAERLRSTVDALEDALTEVISHAQASGEISSNRPAGDLARFFVMTAQGLRVMGAINPDRRFLMTTVEVAVACFD